MTYIIRLKSDRHGRRWRVREAKSLACAVNAVHHAMVTGSIGSKDVVDETLIGGRVRVLADVALIHSDGSDVKPYEVRR
jgi:hypothetical protein